MKKTQLFVLSCAGLISVLAFTSANASLGNRPGALTVSVGAGFDHFDAKFYVQNSDLSIVRVGYDFTQNWGVEGLVGVFKTKFSRNTGLNNHVNGDLLAFDAVYHLMPDQMVQPYVLAGVGSMGMNPTIDNANNEGNINAALGAQLFLHKSFAFRLEARDNYTWVGDKTDLLVSAGFDVLIDFC